MKNNEERLYVEKIVKIVQHMRPNVNIQISELFDDEFRDIVVRAILSKQRENEKIKKNIKISGDDLD